METVTVPYWCDDDRSTTGWHCVSSTNAENEDDGFITKYLKEISMVQPYEHVYVGDNEIEYVNYQYEPVVYHSENDSESEYSYEDPNKKPEVDDESNAALIELYTFAYT